jgi:hypothetical protein
MYSQPFFAPAVSILSSRSTPEASIAERYSVKVAGLETLRNIAEQESANSPFSAWKRA